VAKHVSSYINLPHISISMGFEYLLAWLVPLAQVLPRPQLIFPSKTWFFGIYLNFQWEKSLRTQHLAHSESKSYQINSIKSCSSRSFQQHQRHIPIPPKFSAWTQFNFEWKNHKILKSFCTVCPSQAMHPSSWRAFQRHQKHDLKHTSSVYLIVTEQNKQPSFIDRCSYPMSKLKKP
jgi:hypothetical protein